MRPHLAAWLSAALVAACSGGALGPPAGTADAVATSATASPDPSPTPTPSAGPSRVATGQLTSRLLDRSMPYVVFLPPGYDTYPERRYPALYLLHGMSGSHREWLDIGLEAAANEAFASRRLEPFVIVLPQGDQAYWMDHANGGPRWGAYVAQEVVGEIDARYRTVARRDARAIGGLSMGGHGALQLALNFPDVFAVAGAHSPTLRREDQALSFFGKGADFAARDPVSLVRAKPEVARRLAIAIDIAATDSWAPAATALHDALQQLGIAHEWRTPPGDHSNEYWSAQLPTYLGVYARAFAAAR